MLRTLPLLFAAAFTSSASAQKLCLDANSGPLAGSIAQGAGDWFCWKFTPTQTLVLTGLEIRGHSGTAAAITSMAVFAFDPVTQAPGSQLLSAVATFHRSYSYYGGHLGPITLRAGVPVCFGFLLVPQQGGVWIDIPRQTPNYEVWMGSPGSWTARPEYAPSFRLYCDSYVGSWTNFGTGKVGYNRAAPELSGLGFPNLGNPIGWTIEQVRPNAVGALVLGTQVNQVIAPFGTLYASPQLFLPLVSTALPWPEASLSLMLPVDPRLVGVRLAAQAWFDDAAAPAGLTHTEGLEMLIDG